MEVRNLVYYSSSMDIQDALVHLRIIAPFNQVGINLINGNINGQTVSELVVQGDIVLIQRDFPGRYADYQRVIKIARRERKLVVMDLDDLLLFLPEDHPDRKTGVFSSSLLPILEAVIEADLVTAATPKLQGILTSYNKNVVVLPNYFDESLWKLRPPILKSKSNTLKIGYMGGHSHAPDIEYIKPVLLDMIKRYPDKIRFHFWGTQPPECLRNSPQVEWTPSKSYIYKDFSEFFQTQSADIFIAPLVDTLFNRCKSPLKFFEYSALGAPGVFSNLETYSETITHGKNGLLAYSLDEWTDGLIQLIENDELRFQLASSAQQTIRENWLLAQNAYRWNDAFEHVTRRVKSKKVQDTPLVNILSSINLQSFEANNTFRMQAEEKEKTAEELIGKKEQAMQVLIEQKLLKENELEEIHRSKTWRLVNLLWRIRVKLLPRGSIRIKFVSRMYPFLLSSLRKIWHIYSSRKDLKIIHNSNLFDRTWYLEQNPDVAKSGMDPVRHYLLFGGLEGRNPCIDFSSKWYLEANPDVRAAKMNPLLHYLKFGRGEGRSGSKTSLFSLIDEKSLNKKWAIMATPHTLFVAHLLAEHLQKYGCQVLIITEPPTIFPYDFYIVVCPQMFPLLPPGEKRIVFQMEQSVSSRWFTKEYFQTLEESLFVLEYNLQNIKYLAQHRIKYPNVYFLPISASLSYGRTQSLAEGSPTKKVYDVLFYGDDKSSPRRQKMLKAIAQQFNLKIASEIFGEDIMDIIRQARIVINIHYYENALLEIPRIQECLSLGVPVISEAAQDQEEYPDLAGVVRFFEQNSIPSMIQAIKEGLENPVPPEQILASIQKSAKRFDFMFDRFLVGAGALPAQYITRMTLPALTSKVVLSMPETIVRREVLLQNFPEGFTLFDGIRRQPGWVGCGLSYSTLAHNALDIGLDRLTVMEDDILFGDDFQDCMRIINEYLDKEQGKWDIFAGFIASLHAGAKVLKVKDYKGIRFITIDKMTSTVCNIYGRKVLQLIAAWDPDNLDVQHNTIDRYLEGQGGLRVVTTLPYLVGHREELNSVIWNFQNKQYHEMVATSLQTLQEKVRKYQLYQKLP